MPALFQMRFLPASMLFALVPLIAAGEQPASARSDAASSPSLSAAASDAPTSPAAAAKPNEWDNGVVDTDGFMRIAWRLQTQEDVYGFNVYRADAKDGEYEIINDFIIPGHGTTALPKEYEYIDSSLDQGRRYYYYVTEVTTTGAENDITPKVGAVAKPRSFYVERGQMEPEE